MNNVEFRKILVKLEVCMEALEWLGEQEPKAAWDSCGTGADHFDWLEWLVRRLSSLNALYADYLAKRAPLWAEFEAKAAPGSEEYNAKRASLDAEYKAKATPMGEEAVAKRLALFAEYYAKCDPLRVEHWAKCDVLFYSLFPWSVVEAALLKNSVSP